MARNDIILLDGILNKRCEEEIPSSDASEVFEYIVYEQYLKNYGLSSEEIASGWVDGTDDGGIDGFYVFVSGRLIDDEDKLEFIPKSNILIKTYIFTCKNSTEFVQKPVNYLLATFKEFFDLTLENSKLVSVYSNELLEKRSLFIDIIKKSASDDTKHELEVIYASKGDSHKISQSVYARGKMVEALLQDYFNCSSEFKYIGANDIVEIYRKHIKSTLVLKCKEILAFDTLSYLAIVDTVDYLNFITDENGQLKRFLFDSNVRDYLPCSNINLDIYNSLNNNDINFWWLNNGITILSTHVSNNGKEINVTNVQIVNGLQTSESIYKYYEGHAKIDGQYVLIKILVSSDNEMRDKIIFSTNSQNAIDSSSLRATDKIQRDIEEVLDKKGYYYERRSNYYKNLDIPDRLIVSPQYIASAFVALVRKQPQQAVRLKQRIFSNEDTYNKIFNPNININIWHVIVRIFKQSDAFLLTKRKIAKKKNEFYVESQSKKIRPIISYLAAGYILKTFNFTVDDLLKFDFSCLGDDVFELCYSTCNNIQGFWKKGKIRKEFIRIRNKFSEEYNIVNVPAPSKKVGDLPTRSSQLSEKDSMLIAINKLLPEQPWPVDIHLEISKQLSLPPEFVNKTISELISRRIRFCQYKGVVFDLDLNPILTGYDAVETSAIIDEWVERFGDVYLI